MKPLIFIPPAQAEALSDTQGDLMPDDLRSGDFGPRQPWRDDDGAEEWLPPALLPHQHTASAVSKAQLWPSSANNSR